VSPDRARQLHHAGGLPSPIAVDHHGPFWPRDVIESWAEREWLGYAAVEEAALALR
jgi:hypothetical protein